MPNNYTNLDSFGRSQSSWIVAASIVTTLHIVFILAAIYSEPTPKKNNVRNKVFVQTISLTPTQSLVVKGGAEKLQSIAEARIPPSPVPLPEVIKEEPPAIIKEVPPIKEVLPQPPAPSPTPKVEVSPPPLKTPPKVENKPKPKPPSPPPAQEVKKAEPPKKPSPSTKVAEPVKTPVKVEPEKKKVDDAEKKKVDDAEKKRQQEKVEAEKKRLLQKAEENKKKQEQAEAEKKRQQEKAEAEKKKQKELEELERKNHEIYLAKIAKSQENLSKIGQSRDKINTYASVNLDSTPVPKELGDLQIDALPTSDSKSQGWSVQEITYREKIASHLKKALRLPDFGAVTVKLTINRDGKVLKVVTVQSENNKNKVYIENEVPKLQFPRFGQEFSGESESTFQFHLHNDS